MAAGTVRESKVLLTAEDKTAGAFASLQANLRKTADDMAKMQTVFAGLAAGAALGGFAAMIKQTVDYADSLNKMSQKTGIATDELSKLAYAAKLSDVSNESLTKGIKGLSEMMVKAIDATSVQADTMKALGVDIRGGVEPALGSIANMFAKLPDGVTKTTLAVDLFGKAGQELIPLLNQGSEGINKLKDEADKLGLTINGETAKAAEQFNDNMRALNESSKRLGITIVNDAAPAMVKVTEAMKNTLVESGKLQAVLVGIGGTLSYLFTDEFLTREQTITKEMSELTKQAQHLMQVRAGEAGWFYWVFGASSETLTGQIDSLSGRIAKLRGELDKARTDQKAKDDLKRTLDGLDAIEGEYYEEQILNIQKANAAAKKSREEILRWNERLAKQDVQGWVAYADAVFEEADKLNTELAKINQDYWAGAEKLRLADEKGWVAYIDATINEYERELTEAGKQTKSWHQTQIDEWKPFMDGIENAFRDGFGRMLEGGRGWWKSFTQGLANTFKTTVADFAYQAFAKPLTLQLVASTAGAFGLSGLATAANAASGTGAGLSLLSGGTSLASGIGSLFGGGATGANVWAGAGFGEAAGGGLLGSLGSSLAAAAPYLAAIAAAYALIKKFGDKGENPQAMLGFGSGAQAYVGQGVFGAEGFKSIQTDDAFNKSLQAYFASFKAMDEGLAKMLSDSQRERIASVLSASAQREFAFPKGDGTAGEQLSVEYLRSKYAVVFGELDKTFADFVRNFTGSAEDLQKSIAEESAVLGLLSNTSKDILGQIPDLTIDGLRAMQQAGEGLSATFQRVVGEFVTAQNSLNAAIGARNPGFARDMVLSQRNAIGLQFAQIIGQQYGGDLASQMALNPQGFSGLNANGMSLLAQWLQLQSTLEQLDEQLAGGQGSASSAIGTFTDAALGAANALMSARTGLASYLNGSLLSDLSPLNPMARYQEAKRQFDSNLVLAQSGNVDAISGFGSIRDQFLQASRAIYASSGQYNSDFYTSFNAGATLTNGAVRPLTAADFSTGVAAIVESVATTASGQQVTNTILVDYLNELANGNTSSNSTKQVELLQMLNDRLRINGGALTSGNQALA